MQGLSLTSTSPLLAGQVLSRVLLEVQKDLAAQGTGLVLAHVQSDLKPDLDRHHLTEAIGPNRIFDTLHEACAALRGSLP
jgi:SulP family sulfate permease